MRYVDKDLKNVPPSLQSKKALEDIEKIANGDKELISDRIYKGEYKDTRGKLQSQVRDYLNQYYYQKCAYCEDFCKAEIEHYRPKKGVVEDENHNGYYWLCYEWSNLVPSCRYCNTEGGKGNKFPIINKNKRVLAANFKLRKLDISKNVANKNPLIDEQPYLLHPEIDKYPEVFFSFRIDDKKEGIKMIGIDTENRGEKTIEICNLNRTDLKLKRLENVYYQIKNIIDTIFTYLAERQLPPENLNKALGLVFKRIEVESKNDELTFTLLRKFVITNVQNFELYFAPYLDNDEQRIITIEAFKNYKSGNV